MSCLSAFRFPPSSSRRRRLRIFSGFSTSGRSAREKDCATSWRLFAQLRHPRKELVIVGPRSEPSGLEGISIPDDVRFTGVLKGDDLSQAYRTASVFVLPTLEEGLALVLGEALAHGTPVIATVNSGGADLFTDGEEGFLVPNP